MTEPQRREPEKTGAWQDDRNGNRFRILVIEGSSYIQYENDMGHLRPYNPQSSVQNQTTPRYRPGSTPELQRTKTVPETRKEHSGQRHNVNYAPYSGTQRSASTNPRASQPEIVQAPPFRIFPKEDDSTGGYGPSPPDRANYSEAHSESASVRRGSRDRAGTYHVKTHYDQDVVIEPGVTKRTGSTAPPQVVTRPLTNTPASTTAGTATQPLSQFSEYAEIFLKIPEGDFGTCQEFMAKNPEIFDENPNDFLPEAVRLQVEGKASQARSRVQQSLLLRKVSKKSRKETQVFFSRLKVRDTKELDAFHAEFDTIYNVIKTSAAAAQSNPIKPLEAISRPDSMGPDNKSARPAPAGDRHAPEPAFRASDDGMSVPMERLNVSSHDQPDPLRTHGPASNASRPPHAAYRSGGGRRPTLSSVDEHSRPKLSNNNQSQGATPSIADYDIRGNGETYEQLDDRYHVRTDGGKFFKFGRVFAMLWHEGAGELKGGHLSNKENFRVGKFGEIVHSHILRMVVVKERHGYCWCIPIHTYHGRGVLKQGFNRQDQEAHAIIHMDDTKPTSTSKAEFNAMSKIPIAVHAASPDQKLDLMSRLNFGAPYSIQMNVKVMNVGKVISDSMPALESYWRNEMNS